MKSETTADLRMPSGCSACHDDACYTRATFRSEDNMNRVFRAACLVFVIGIAFSAIILACGDKFLVSSRGTRYEKAPIKRDPRAILILANPASDVAKGLSGV